MHSITFDQTNWAFLWFGEEGCYQSNWLISAAFYAEKIDFFYKTSYLNKEVNCTEPSPSVGVPGL
jgi:hypothetical protein